MNRTKRLLAACAVSFAVLATGGGTAFADEPSTTPAATTSEAPAAETTPAPAPEPAATTPVETTPAAPEQTSDAPVDPAPADDPAPAPAPSSQEDQATPAATSDTSTPEAGTSSEAPAAAPASTSDASTSQSAGDVSAAIAAPPVTTAYSGTRSCTDTAEGSVDRDNTAKNSFTASAVTSGLEPNASYDVLFSSDQFYLQPGVRGNPIFLVTVTTDATGTFPSSLNVVDSGIGIQAGSVSGTVEIIDSNDNTVLTTSFTVNACGGTTPPPVQQAPTVDLTADKATITLGESVNLSWTTTNSPDTLVASGAWNGNKAIPSGSETVTPTAAGTYTYDLTASNKTGSSKDSVTVVVNPVLVPPVGDCSTEIDSAAFVVTYPSVSYEIQTLLPACEDIVAYGDAYTLPDSYDGNGFNASASPQQFIPGARAVLTIKKGETSATATGSVQSGCDKFVQVDIYTGPQQDTVTYPEGNNGFLVGGISSEKLPACDTTTPPGDGGNTPVPPGDNGGNTPVVPTPVVTVPVTVPVTTTPSQPGTPPVVNTPAPVSNIHPGIATAHAGDSAPSSDVDRNIGIALTTLLMLATTYAVFGRRRKAQHKA